MPIFFSLFFSLEPLIWTLSILSLPNAPDFSCSFGFKSCILSVWTVINCFYIWSRISTNKLSTYWPYDLILSSQKNLAYEYHHHSLFRGEKRDSEKLGNLYVCVLTCSVVSDSLRIQGLLSARLLCPRNFPGKNIGVGCHFLLQGIFLIQG